MKRTISIAFVAFALLSFTSCQKENLVSGNQEPAHRTITATFENDDTKTTLGTNDIPLWAEGDKICILASNDSEVIELQESNITEEGRKVTFTLTKELSGTLYAVYPASATTMTSCTDGNINFTIPELQDGTFGSANICVAKSTATDATNKDNLIFSNATSVLEFSQTASSTGVLRVAVTAANAIAGKCTATFGTDNKATISTSELTGKLIWTSAPTTAQDKYYVAIAPVETGAVNFKYYNTELKEKNEAKSSKTLAQNKIYELTIPTEDYENSYVEITMTVGGEPKTYKWAKCNVGATKETEYGDYYVWGATVKAYSAVDYTKTTGAFTFVTSNPYGDIYNNTWNASNGFSWNNTPFINGVYSVSNKKVFTKYVPEAMKSNYGDGGTFYDNKDVLDNKDDVAHKVLGGTWRMPTKEEFDALCSLSSKEWKSDYKNSGVNGYLFTDNNSHSIFLPAAGCGYGTGLSYVGGCGLYWSSSLYADYPRDTYYLDFRSDGASTKTNIRYYGMSVRALSE